MTVETITQRLKTNLPREPQFSGIPKLGEKTIVHGSARGAMSEERLRELIVLIRKDLDRSGKHLCEVHDEKGYRIDDHKNITDFSFAEFGIKKTQTYAWMGAHRAATELGLESGKYAVTSMSLIGSMKDKDIWRPIWICAQVRFGEAPTEENLREVMAIPLLEQRLGLDHGEWIDGILDPFLELSPANQKKAWKLMIEAKPADGSKWFTKADAEAAILTLRRTQQGLVVLSDDPENTDDSCDDFEPDNAYDDDDGYDDDDFGPRIYPESGDEDDWGEPGPDPDENGYSDSAHMTMERAIYSGEKLAQLCMSLEPEIEYAFIMSFLESACTDTDITGRLIYDLQTHYETLAERETQRYG